MDISTLAPAQSASTSTALSQLTGNLDSFLTLLTTQLKNQDPLDPLDTEKFTSQLVQFASVEQSIQTNKNLEMLIGLQAAADRDGALAMIGKTVMIEADVAAHVGSGATWSYELPRGATSVSLTVLDAKGQAVAQAVGDTGVGVHAFAWNGKLENGGQAPDGAYRLVVQAKDANGGAAPYAVMSSARVTGVTFGATGPLLETAGGAISLSGLRRVLAGE